MNTNTTTTTTTKTEKPKRLARLIGFLDQQATEEGKSGFARNERDLRALVRFLRTVEREMPAALSVPEWGNHLDDNGKPYGLGTTSACYAAWVEEGEEPAQEHDGACQLAEIAQALRGTLNELDRLTDAR